jgi:hypothetical protein
MNSHFAFVLLLSAAGLALWIWGSSRALLALNWKRRFPSFVQVVGRLRPPQQPVRPRPWQAVITLLVLLFVPAGMAAMLRQGGLEPPEEVVLLLGLLGVTGWTFGLVVVSITSPRTTDVSTEVETTKPPAL